jgi:hypothetical protein
MGRYRTAYPRENIVAQTIERTVATCQIIVDLPDWATAGATSDEVRSSAARVAPRVEQEVREGVQELAARMRLAHPNLVVKVV